MSDLHTGEYLVANPPPTMEEEEAPIALNEEGKAGVKAVRKAVRTANRVGKALGHPPSEALGKVSAVSKWAGITERYMACRQDEFPIPVCAAAEVANQAVRRGLQGAGALMVTGGAAAAVAHPIVGGVVMTAGTKAIMDSDDHGNQVAQKLLEINRADHPRKNIPRPVTPPLDPVREPEPVDPEVAEALHRALQDDSLVQGYGDAPTLAPSDPPLPLIEEPADEPGDDPALDREREGCLEQIDNRRHRWVNRLRQGLGLAPNKSQAELDREAQQEAEQLAREEAWEKIRAHHALTGELDGPKVTSRPVERDGECYMEITIEEMDDEDPFYTEAKIGDLVLEHVNNHPEFHGEIDTGRLLQVGNHYYQIEERCHEAVVALEDLRQTERYEIDRLRQATDESQFQLQKYREKVPGIEMDRKFQATAAFQAPAQESFYQGDQKKYYLNHIFHGNVRERPPPPPGYRYGPSPGNGVRGGNEGGFNILLPILSFGLCGGGGGCSVM